MKKDQYIPHEVSMRNTSEVMNLIENEGMEGYGIYWALMEYLRTQDGYIGRLEVLKSLARQLRIRLPKLHRIMRNYGLFCVTDTTFVSPKLNEVMKPLEERRTRIEAYKRRKQEENTLETSEVSDGKNNIVSFEGKGEGEGKEEEKTSSPKSSSSAVAAVKDWEQYVDQLQHDEQWMELAAMRSGMQQRFFSLFPRILESFKRHVRSLGNEGSILSEGDAKHYFYFFLNPSSPTYKNLILELQKPVDKGVYRYEDLDPTTGRRSYCGVEIPAEAPPRPNDQAVWVEGKWVY